MGQEELKVEGRKVIDRLRQALEGNDVNQWLVQIASEDDLVLQAQSQWFLSYRKEHEPDQIQFEILTETLDEKTVHYECKISLEYLSFQNIVEHYRYTIQYIEGIDQYKIIWIERLKQIYTAPDIIVRDPVCLFPARARTIKENWWENRQFLQYAKEETVKEDAGILARAIPRTIRFREGHIFIECASLLVNMMSEHVARWALEINDQNNVQTLANLHNAMSKRMLVRLVREDRDNTWSSKYVVPWYGVDEMVRMRESDEYLSGNCPVILGIYYAILKLCDDSHMDIWQLRMDNHEAMMVKLEKGTYFLTSDELRIMDEKLLYYAKSITKIYNAQWIWTNQGITNLTVDARNKLMEGLKATGTRFVFSQTVKKQIGQDMDEIFKNMPTVKEYRTSRQLVEAVKDYVFRQSCQYPDSPYTWAKYAYQSLYVQKPEAYLIWSTQSQIVEDFINNVENASVLERIISGYGTESIFEEDDRIMTADQVIRRKTGDGKAKAILYYAWKKKKDGAKGYVVITDRESYYAEIQEDSVLFISMEDFRHKESCSGEFLLVMDQKRSYFPLISDKNREMIVELGGLRNGL